MGALVNWGVDDIHVDLSSFSNTPATNIKIDTYDEFVQSDGITYRRAMYNFVCNSDDLGERPFYTFSLSVLAGNNLLTVHSLELPRNSPPGSGVVSVLPSIGLELVTSFTLRAYGWEDDDLPLKYDFFYFWHTLSAMIPIESRVERSNIQSSLPAGSDIDGFNLTCYVQIYDSYYAYSTTSTTVTVTPDERFIDSFQNYVRVAVAA
jgi:hypothetical protein